MTTLYINGLFPGELKPDATVAGCVDIFENVWPNPQHTIDLVEQAVADPNNDYSWVRAPTIGDGVFQDARTNKALAISYIAESQNDPLMQNIHNQFFMCIMAGINPYGRRYKINESFYQERYSLLKYSDNQQYKAHYDGGTETGRALTVVLYLNNDFEGGEIEFVNFDVKIKPQPGMMLIFPSNYAYTHIAHPVTKGTKYALVTWVRDQTGGITNYDD